MNFYKRIRVNFAVVGALGLIVIVIAGFQNCSAGFTPSEKLLSSESTQNAVVTLTLTSTSHALSSDKTQVLKIVADPQIASQITSYNCALDGAAPSLCTTALTLENLTDGSHLLAATAVGSGGVKISEGSYSFVVDTVPPLASINVFPGAISGTSTLNAQFSASDAVSGVDHFNCYLDGAALGLCESPYIKPGLSEGAHTFAVEAVDKVGLTSLKINKSWTLSSKAPSIVVSSVPAYSGPSLSINFSTSSQAGVALTSTCSLDGAAAVACADSFAASGLTDGPHSLAISAVDAAGNSATSVANWSTDLTPPTVTVLSANNQLTNTLAFAVSFSSTDAKSGVAGCECAKNGGGFGACSSPFSVAFSTDGPQSATIRCRDLVGNTSAPATINWTFDRTPPVFTFSTTTPTSTSLPSATFSYSSSDAISPSPVVQVSVNGGAYTVASGSPLTVNGLSDGNQSIAFRAVDQAGNSSAPQNFNWTVDRIAPTDPQDILTSLKSGQLKATWTSTDSGSGIDHYEFKAGRTAGASDLLGIVSLPVASYSFYAAGVNSTSPFYFVSVRAFDHAGNVSQWVNSVPRSYNIDGSTLGCAAGAICQARDLVDTSLAALQSGNLSTQKIVLARASDLVKMRQAFGATSPFKDLTDTFGGTLTVACTVNGNAAPCDLNSGFSLPTVPTKTVQTLKMDVHFNGSPYFSSSFNFMIIPWIDLYGDPAENGLRFATSMVFDRSTGIAAVAGVVNPTLENLFIAPDTSVSYRAGICTQTDGRTCRLVIGDRSTAVMSYMNFGYRPQMPTMDVFVGANSFLISDIANVANFHITPGATVIINKYLSMHVSVLSDGVPADPCGFPAGATCPGGTVVIH
jgi:hypothetical protein